MCREIYISLIFFVMITCHSFANNFDEIMRRIEPFIRRPKEEPRERQNWVSSGSSVPMLSGKRIK